MIQVDEDAMAALILHAGILADPTVCARRRRNEHLTDHGFRDRTRRRYWDGIRHVYADRRLVHSMSGA